MFISTGKSFAGSFVLEGQYHTLSIFSMLSQMLALKFGWMKRAKSARSFFIRPPLCSKNNLEYLKIDYTSIRTPDQMAYNGKPLSGWWAAKNIQVSCFKFRLLIRNSRIFSVRMLLFNQEQHMEMKSYKCRGEI